MDIWYNILLNSDINDINKIINKTTVKIIHDKQFWIDKFKHDHLPLLTMSNDMIKEYNKTLLAHQAAILFKNVLNNAVNPQIYMTGYYFEEMNWLPNVILEHIESTGDIDLVFNAFLYINVRPEYSIQFDLSREPIEWDVDESLGEHYETTIVKLNNKEFILFLTKLFYYVPDVELMVDGKYYSYYFLIS